MRGRLWNTAVIGTVLSGAIGAMLAPPVMSAGPDPRSRAPRACEGGLPGDENPDQVLEWNQIFIDTLINTNTANSSSQRLGAIVHTAIFDAYNGVEKRYTHVLVEPNAPAGRVAAGGRGGGGAPRTCRPVSVAGIRAGRLLLRITRSARG